MDKKEQLVKYWKERGIITDTRVLGAFLKVNRDYCVNFCQLRFLSLRGFRFWLLF